MYVSISSLAKIKKEMIVGYIQFMDQLELLGKPTKKNFLMNKF